MAQHETLTPAQVAEYMQLSISTVYRALEDGRIPGTKLTGRWRTLRSQLEDRVRDNRVPPRIRSPQGSPTNGSIPRSDDRFRTRVVELNRPS